MAESPDDHLRTLKNLRANSTTRAAQERLLFDADDPKSQEKWNLIFQKEFTVLQKTKAVLILTLGLICSSTSIGLVAYFGGYAFDPNHFADSEYIRSMPMLKFGVLLFVALAFSYSILRFVFDYYFTPKVTIGKIRALRYISDSHQRRFLAVQLEHDTFQIPKSESTFLWASWLVRITHRRFTKEVLKVELEVRPPNYVPPHQIVS
jgi:hypothetical protein